MGHWYLGFILFAQGEYSAAQGHLKQMLSFYDPQQHHQPLLTLRSSDSGLSALAYDACCLWCLGYPDQALERRRETLALARELAHPLSLVEVLYYAGCMLDAMRGDAQALKDSADEFVQLAKKHEFSGWLASATNYQGQALSLLGQPQQGIDQMRQGLETLEQIKLGAWCYMPGTLQALGEAHAIVGQPEQALSRLDEALALIAKNGEHHWEVELHRTRGEMLLSQGHEQEAEASLHRAIEIARQQKAKSWELRAAISLCRLWHAQDSQESQERARDLLAEVYGWFTEGFDTADLKEARALLKELS
jgi:predicted ATPase